MAGVKLGLRISTWDNIWGEIGWDWNQFKVESVLPGVLLLNCGCGFDLCGEWWGGGLVFGIWPPVGPFSFGGDGDVGGVKLALTRVGLL